MRLQPHILLLVADDYSWELLPRGGAASPHAVLQPSITRHLVEDGFSLTRHYAASMCAPSRAALMTGRWPHRAYDFSADVERFWACKGISPAVSTLAEKLKGAGYLTHMIVRSATV